MAFIELSELAKVYRRGDSEICVLDGVNLAIERGEFVALMGPSGSGKTTLLNVIAGIDHPNSGRVTIDGVEISALSDAACTAWRTRGIGYVFQSYNLIPVLTAYENVELPLLLLDMDEKARREHVEVALAAVGLADRAAHFPRQLSGGQEQRVAIARAIVTDAGILIADEPTGNLDAAAEEEILDLLGKLNRDHGKTVVMVTHNPEAAAHAGRIVKLDKGRLACHMEVRRNA